MITLYYAPNTGSLASHIALEDAGADYTAVRINLKEGEQRSPAYLAVNPKGRVPAMATDQGFLTETPALLAFIAQSFPAARLAPLDDPFGFAQVQAFNLYICATLHVAHGHRWRPDRWVDDETAREETRQAAPGVIGTCWDMIEQSLFVGPWAMGDAYTICDPYLFTFAQWIELDGVDPGRFPKIMDHHRRMSERANVRKAIAEEMK